jgi:hypothetical protein
MADQVQLDMSTFQPIQNAQTQQQPQQSQQPSGAGVSLDMSTFQPLLDLSNKQGEGTYQMTDQSGNTVAVPYSQVSQATKTGYNFADSDTFNRFRKDVSADPNNKGDSWNWFSSPNLTPEQQTVVEQQNKSQLGQAATGVVKGVGDLGNMIANTPSAIVHSLPPVAFMDSVKQSVPIIDAYEQARSSGASVYDALQAANEQAKKQSAVMQTIKQTVAEFQKNPTQETARLVTNAAGLLAMAYATGGAGAGADAEAAGVGAEGAEAATGAEAGADAATPAATATPAVKSPGLIKQILNPEGANQPMAQSAVRNAVSTSAQDAGTATDDMLSNIKSQPILKNGETIIDDHLNALRQQSKDAYAAMDDAAGMDLKAEKAQLANDQYKLGNLGNTDADINARGNLIEAINDSTDRIAEAEQKLTDAGIDPKAADRIHQQLRAGLDFKKALVQSSDSNGVVNVDKLLTASKNLRFSKYGDRLSQFFGSDDAADSYMSQLQQAQDLGIHAMKANGIAKLVGKWTAAGIIGGGAAHVGFELLK